MASGKKFTISYPIDETAGNSAEEYFSFDERCRLVSAIYTDKDGVVQDGSNYITFTVGNAAGTKTYLTYSTKTADQGTITAKTATYLIDGADADECIFAENTPLAFKATAAGSGKALDGTVVLTFEKERLFS